MKASPAPFKYFVLTLLPFALLVACESTDTGSPSSSNVDYGAGSYDLWYYGGYYPPDVVTRPPPDGSDQGPRPTHPIAMPSSYQNPTPRPMPSIPSTPRISPRR
jgi:hypothetical protein